MERSGRTCGIACFTCLAREAKFVGRARIQGRLFRLGEYPGLVLSRDPDRWVHGEVYALDRPSDTLPDTLARLDDYEGCGPDDPEPHEFERVEQDIILESGARDKAWVYIYEGSTANMREILSGDYFQEDS